MQKRKVNVDVAIRIIKDSIDGMGMDGFEILVEHLMPCKNVTYLVETDEIEYELDELNIDVFSDFSTASPEGDPKEPESKDLS
jgi:hypothetical protein